jgi:hypothetical protein
MKKLVLLLLLTGASALCAAQDQAVDFRASGNAFLRICDNANIVDVMRGECLGYVNGVIDGFHGAYALHNSWAGRPVESGQPFCFRPDVTMGQRLRVVTQFLKTHPEKTDLPMDILIYEATVEAFPCPKPSKSERVSGPVLQFAYESDFAAPDVRTRRPHLWFKSTSRPL